MLRDVYVEKAVKSELYIESSNLSNTINREIVNKSKENIYITLINKISDDEIAITYSNNTKSNIKINRENHSISFGNYNVKILDKADIGNIELYYNYDNISLKRNGICNIKIPITHKDYPNDFGVVVTYRYDSSKTIVNGTPGAVADVDPVVTPVNTDWTFEYTGTVQSFVAPETGRYKLEVWGAQGGNSGGEGGYTVGIKSLQANDEIYVVVGAEGNTYNGGGDGTIKGGGATHIALTNLGELKNYESNTSDLLVVAGGGGGQGDFTYHDTPFGGVGGGLTGGNGTATYNSGNGVGGTQLAGGRNGGTSSVACEESDYGSFGQGGAGGSEEEDSSGAGGGGFYGGGGGSCRDGGGGGGSGYIGTVTDGNTIAGNESMPTHNGTSTMTGNTGNGYAKITYLGN